jgi:hypothetical protein
MKPVAHLLFATAATVGLVCATFGAAADDPAAPIDRKALVTRHNPVLRAVDVDGPLTVGNGGFAFGCDITGLQTFAEHYHRWGIPTETLSRWCWVTEPNPNNYQLADANRDFVQGDGHTVGYPTRAGTPAGDWLRKNPHDHPLGQIAFDFVKNASTPFGPDDVENPEQTLDLWGGVVTSHFALEGVAVEVTTVCHPETDLVAVRVDSELVSRGKLRVRLAFPRGHDLAIKNTPPLDWSEPDSHQTRIVRRAGQRLDLVRSVESTMYHVAVAWRDACTWEQTMSHEFRFARADGGSRLEFVVGFSPKPFGPTLPDFEATLAASRERWEEFWSNGAAVDFSGSTDPRAVQIEKRIVLSRYLMAVQMAGDVPPQESGLTCSTWYGKHHSEMIWWHAAHFPLWGNDALLEKNLDWFRSQLPAARALAASRGLQGARWAKMTGPEMRESPGGNPLIVWNQPHMVYLCELLYRNRPTPETLAKYHDLVLETADCLATMVYFDNSTGYFSLGPPLWIAQEIYDQATSKNPSYELAYWRWALVTAQQWRERLGLPREERWDYIVSHLAPIPQKDGKYVALGSHPDTWDNIDSRHDHPTMLAPLGILPGGPDVDRATMERTLDAVLATWDWETKIWGWDYPMIAMTAARLGLPDVAVEILLREGPNNRYTPNGHCPQRSDEKMPKDPPPGARKREIAVYLPANGAFLQAAALMIAGWDGCTEKFPGFPKDGTWTIRAEGVRPMP